MSVPVLTFAEFTLDAAESALFVGDTRIPLSPKDCALLHHLVTHAGTVISHRELLEVAWKDQAVTPDVLKVRISRLRRLLGDDAASPRFIANVHGDGYCFLSRLDQVRVGGPEMAERRSRSVVGRARELARLGAALEDAGRGRRRVVFVTGEAGIGKTALIDQFLSRFAPVPDSSSGPGHARWVGRGQCIAHYGSGEPYLPVMEALSRIAQTSARDRLIRALRQYAPTWLMQLPALTTEDERQVLQARAAGSEDARQRMLRELAEALESLGDPDHGPSPMLVLVIEDLQWADVSTLDLLSMLARRRESACLLIVASCRSRDLVNEPSLGPLLLELRVQDTVSEIRLGPLDRGDVAAYLAAYCGPDAPPPGLDDILYARTAGNPLFLKEVLRDLRSRGLLVNGDNGWTLQGDMSTLARLMPESLRQLVSEQASRLGAEDQRVIEAASVAGVECSTTEIAAALGADLADTEDRCLRLSERQEFLQASATAEWPDGTPSMTFRFLHALYQELWQQRVGAKRLQEWHLRIAERKEAGYGNRAAEIAPELAIHFEHGGDFIRAIAYREHASQLALQRAAHVEARSHLDRAFAVLPKLPDTPARWRVELRLQIVAGTWYALTAGYGSPDAAASFERAHQLCRQIGDRPELIESAFGLCRFFWSKGDFSRARDLIDQMSMLIGAGANPIQSMAAHAAIGSVLLGQGELSGAAHHLKAGLELAQVHWTDGLLGLYASDLEIVCAGSLANTLLITGFGMQADRLHSEALRIGRSRSHPVATAGALGGAVLYHCFGDQPEKVLPFLHELSGLPPIFPFVEALRGWAFVATGRGNEGLEILERGTTTFLSSGVGLYEPLVLGMLADGYRRMGQQSASRQTLADALRASARNGPNLFEAELHRLDGELHADAVADVRSGAAGGSERTGAAVGAAAARAEQSFARAAARAREQGATLWELRATLSLARLRQRLGTHRDEDLRALVFDVYARLPEAFETPDVIAARRFVGDERRSPSSVCQAEGTAKG
ncbi:MAG: AAA family ATPase [Acidobacteria bacterium]|nr:AAA family ATPase [Acidobacteriota bacterium]